MKSADYIEIREIRHSSLYWKLPAKLLEIATHFGSFFNNPELTEPVQHM